MLQHCLGGGTLGALPGLQKAIAGFHMPLFFFASGVLFKNHDPKDYYFRKMKTLVIPYVACQFLNCIIAGISIIVAKFTKYNVYSFLRFEGYWFLQCLLYICLIYYFVYRFLNTYMQNRSVEILSLSIGIGCLSIGIIGYILSKDKDSILLISFFGCFFFPWETHARK